MFVIEGADHLGRIVDVWVDDEIMPDTGTVRPLKCHFSYDRVLPHLATAFETIEAAMPKMQDAAKAWGEAEYQHHEGIVKNVRLMHLNSEGHPGGYQIVGTSDETIAARWYAKYGQAFRDWSKIAGKSLKHAGETPQIVHSIKQEMLV